MKIKEFNLLPKYYPGGSYSGMDYLNVVSWDDWVLEKISGNKLFLKIREGIKGTGQRSGITFKEYTYNKLTKGEKEKIREIFQENIGKTIEEILDLNI